MIKLVKSTFFKEKETKEALARFILNADILSMGDECKKFEKAFAQKQGRKHAVLVSSGSMANLILVQALINDGMFKKGDKIGVSALTWATNVMPLMQLGLVPVLIDVNVSTLNISPATLTPHLNSIKGLFITNVLGLSDDLPKIQRLCKKNNIVLFEDNCESLGSRIAGAMLGNFGIASTFSFFVGHHLSTIEGGMICTDDDTLHEQLVMTRAHGWDRNLHPERQKALRNETNTNDFYAKYTFHSLAYNGRPTEITGFLGNTQLPLLDEMIDKRQFNFKLFAFAVNSNPDFMPLRYDHMDFVSNMAMPVVCVNQEKAEYYKKRFADKVEIRPVIAGSMKHQPFYKKHMKGKHECPNTDFIHENGFYFANNPEMTADDINSILSLLAYNHHEQEFKDIYSGTHRAGRKSYRS